MTIKRFRKRNAELMNRYFINITENLNLKVPIIDTTNCTRFSTKNYENQISTNELKEDYREIVPDSFRFKLLSLDDFEKEILNLNRSGLLYLGPLH